MNWRGRKRLLLAREFGRTGVWLALVLTVCGWLSLAALLAPTRAALAQAQTQLLELDARLADAQATLAPFDLLSRPELLGTVQTLNHLARRAGETPLVSTMFGQDKLRDAVTLTGDWQATLQDRPPLPALGEARAAVQGWQARVAQFHERLTLLALGAGLLFTLLGAWFALGQWALYQQAQAGLVQREREKASTSSSVG